MLHVHVPIAQPHSLALDGLVEPRPERILGIGQQGDLPAGYTYVEPALPGHPDHPRILRAEVSAEDLAQLIDEALLLGPDGRAQPINLPLRSSRNAPM